VSTLSPLQLIAGAGLAGNTALAPSSDLTATIASYRSTALVAPFAATVGNGQASGILGGSYATLLILTAGTCPPLSDSTPVASAATLGILLSNNASAGNSAGGFTSLIPQFGEIYLGSGDNSIFVQVFTSAEGYINSTNNYILSVNNSNSYFGSSFTTMNSLLTADLDQVNLAFAAFGTDLKNLGEAIGLDNLDNLGSPLALLQQISTVAGLTPRLLQELDILNISPDVVFDPPVLLAPLLLLEKVLYRTYQEITGNDLKEILMLLNVTTPGITSLADLLNPVKMFPNSFFSLTVKTVNGLRGIYLDRTGSVNFKLLDSLPAYVLDTYQLLAQATPADQALANQCLRVSLQQIKNIFDVPLPALAESYLRLVTTKDLPLINALTTPVPQSVLNFYNTTFAAGTGPENTLILGDLIGAAAGVGYIDKITNAVSILNSLASDPNIANLTVTYQRMNILMNSLSNWGNPAGNTVTIPSGIAQGTYTATYETVTITPEEGPPFDIEVLIETAGGNAFRTGLIPNAQSFINSFVTTNPNTASTLTSNWTSMSQKLISENNNLESASIVIEDLISDQRDVVLGFAQNLPTYGTDTKENGAAQYLAQVANKATLGGQAVVGALRQGRNVAVLNTAGIGTNLEIPDTYQSPPPEANIAAAEYSESEAANLVIR
jgi:hypothetical protein